MRGKISIVLLCAALFSVVAGNVEAAGFRVEAIEVRGASRVAPDAVRKAMSTQVGQELDLEKVRQDVKAIYRMGYFRDVTFDTEEVPGGYRLTVIVAEKPIVAAVQIEGNKDVDTADLRAAVTVKERSLFQEDKVKESVTKLKEVSQNKGFIDASVEASVTEDSDGALRVTFRVAEGVKLKIERIVITGNQFYPTKAVLKVMDTSKKGIFSFISDSGAFKKDVLENDVRKIEALYQNSGFLDSKIFEPVVGRGKKGLIVTIRIFEGRQYRVGEIRFSGESGIPEATLRKKVKLARGELFDRETLLSDLLALTTLVNDQGYAQALVSPGVEKRAEYPVADVTYRFERGTKFHFGRVEISGNTKTMDRVIRHNLDVSDGRTYTATGLKTSKENLTRTSYFKDVKISTAPSTEPGVMDAKIDVQEGPTGTLSGGLGYSSIDKIFGVVQLTENNLFGRGWKASLNSQFGARRTLFSIDFRDPHFLDSDFSLLLGAFKTKVKYTDFEKDSRGGRVGLGYNFSRFVNGSVSLRLDETKILSGVRRHPHVQRAAGDHQGLPANPERRLQRDAEHHGQVHRPLAGRRPIGHCGVRGRTVGRRQPVRQIFPEREEVLPGHRFHHFLVERRLGARGSDAGRRGGPAVREVFPGGTVQPPGVPVPGSLSKGPQHGGIDRREQGSVREPGVPVSARQGDQLQGGFLLRRRERMGAGILARKRRGGVGGLRDGRTLVLPDGAVALRVGMESQPPGGAAEACDGIHDRDGVLIELREGKRRRKMRKAGIILAAAMITAIFAGTSLAEGLRVGVIDMNKVLNESEAGKAAKKKMEARFEELKKTIDAKQEEARKIKEEIDKQKVMLGKEKLKAKEDALQAKVNELRELTQDGEQEMQTRQSELTREVLKSVESKIEVVVKAEKLDLVLERTAGVIHFDASMDISARVLALVNADGKTAPEKKAAPEKK